MTRITPAHPTQRIPGWTAHYGIDGGTTSVKLAVNVANGMAHVLANTGDVVSHFSPDHNVYGGVAVTACDWQLGTDTWWSPGWYDAQDVTNVLDNVMEELTPSFKKVCSRCAKAAAEYGVPLV